jgi:ribosomal protein L32
MTVRMRHTRAHTGNRRAHDKLKKPALVNDADGLHIRHRISKITGKYKGREVVNVTKKIEKKNFSENKIDSKKEKTEVKKIEKKSKTIKTDKK